MAFNVVLSFLLGVAVTLLITPERIIKSEKYHWGWRYLRDKEGRKYLRVATNGLKLSNGALVANILEIFFFRRLLPEWKKRNKDKYPHIDIFGLEVLADNGYIKRSPNFEVFKKLVKQSLMNPSLATLKHYSETKTLAQLKKCIIFVIDTAVKFQGGSLSLKSFFKSFSLKEVKSSRMLQGELKEINKNSK